MPDALAEFKATSTPEEIIFVLSDLRVQRILVAWRGGGPCEGWEPPAGEKPERREEVDWIWNGAEPDFQELAIITGVAEVDIRDIWPIVKYNRIVYPDGTISPHADAVLRGTIGKKLKELAE